MKEWLTEEIVVPVHLAANPLESVAIGTGRSLDVIDKLQKRLNNKIVLLFLRPAHIVRTGETLRRKHMLRDVGRRVAVAVILSGIILGV